MALGLLVLLAALSGCGSGEQVSAPRSGDAGVEFEVKVVRCPRFSDYFVFPTTLLPDVAAEVSVVVSDPDGTRLELAWSATSGSFSDDSSAETTYFCDDLGDQVLTLAATDADDCRRELDLEVTCLEE